mmetsp:Transcript_24262/g.34727  ORF Transcript_24262/g.34727 Transcript_24262/m.34727 type:complete len:624 (+) Transcript_24262:174-2045(+)|eukprot:CAMPEP_0201686360 /NCGR_PEP_ID=MMETSP0578-20130828/834_1 /ASSEMBLY_ACC=CAM_ASM_000663 /TAXON_ID=267565 /ORGANISM="Skeletonema grethea, Strain CCMP 1804" /LENGTH=623 /DNA_ID=CAMNT_0048170409 /DNA_START=172 /DNA_END=2043 /DNA_ORIENTATION=+
MEINSAGQLSSAQILDERIRKGYCGECQLDSNPIKCFEIRKRFGGFKSKRIPLSVAGEAFKGVCLICHPDKDPNNLPRAQRASSERGVSGNGLPTSNNIPQAIHSSAPPVLQQQQIPLELSGPDVEIVEEVTQNLFGQPIVVERPRQVVVSPQVVMQSEGAEDGRVEEQTMDIETPQTDINNCNMNVQPSSSHGDNDDKISDNRESVAQLEDKIKNGEGLDAIARAIQAAYESNPELQGMVGCSNFKPGEAFVPNAELNFEDQTVSSDLTDPTFQSVDSRNRNMITDAALPRPHPIKDLSKTKSQGLASINEVVERQSTSSSTSSEKQISIPSYQIHEPVLNENEYLETSPNLSSLQEFVDMFLLCGEDVQAIDLITGELIKDNAKEMSVDFALYCLHTLLILAKKSDNNKHEILLEGNTFEAIIEAMEIYKDRSAEIQMKGCGLIWSLGIDPKDRKHIAELRGCGAVLNASSAYMENETLQIYALGAMKVLSFDPTGKLKLRHARAAEIVADVMSNHRQNPTIQSEGCVVIGNLANEADGFVHPVSQQEIDSVLSAILNNPDEHEVLQVACFTLASLAASSENVRAINRAKDTTLVLELAFTIGGCNKKVRLDVETLVNRLG